MFYFTILSFIIGVILIFITNMFVFQYFKNKNPKKPDEFIHKQARPTTSLIIKIGFGLIFISIIIKYITTRIEDSTPIKIENKTSVENKNLVDEMSELRDTLSISQTVVLSPSDAKILKEAKSANIFKDKSLCEFYKEYKTLELNGDIKGSDEVIKSLKKIEGLELLFASKGNEFCSVELSEIKEKNNKEIRSSLNISTYRNSEHACSISEDFIKLELSNPATADFSLFDCNRTDNPNGSYTILRKVSAQNSFGVEKEFIFKVTIGYTGGDELEKSSWKLISIQHEEYK